MNIDSFVLIGGRSSRLGRDKALVELDGNTLMHRAVEVARGSLPGSRTSVVAGNSTQFAIDAIRTDTPFIFDLYPNRGPLGGLHAALAHAQSRWIFLLACDYPFMSSDLVGLLADRIDEAFGAVVPEQSDGRMQPLCGFYQVEHAIAIVENILEQPRMAPPMHEIVEQLSPRILKFDQYCHLPNPERLFVNLNTQDDLDAILYCQ